MYNTNPVNVGVHQEHCCGRHGCKYGYASEVCPVENGTVIQSYPCEYCQSVEEIKTEMAFLQEELEWAEQLNVYAEQKNAKTSS